MHLLPTPIRICLVEFERASLSLPDKFCRVEVLSMVEGILVVNLDPPYVGFVQKQDKQGDKKMRGALKNCSLQELRQTLLELGAITPQQQWPPRDCTIRFPGVFSSEALHRVGLNAEPKTSS